MYPYIDSTICIKPHICPEVCDGLFINLWNDNFKEILNDEYIHKSGLISVINHTIGTNRRLSCVSRPSRFGKSFAANMPETDYDCSCDSYELFDDLEIAKAPACEIPEEAIEQMRTGNDESSVEGIGRDLLLVAITYDKDDNTKTHHCRIEGAAPAGRAGQEKVYLHR